MIAFWGSSDRVHTHPTPGSYPTVFGLPGTSSTCLLHYDQLYTAWKVEVRASKQDEGVFEFWFQDLSGPILWNKWGWSEEVAVRILRLD